MEPSIACVDGNEAAARIAHRLAEVVPDLPDHAGLADGRARRRLERDGPAQPLGHRARGDRDAERGGRGGRAARRGAARRARDQLHLVAGPAADVAQPVQDRRRALAAGAARGGPHRRDARALDLRRPQRRDGRAHHRLRDAVRVVRAGGARLRADRPRRDAARPRAVPALLRRLSHLARGEPHRAARRRRPRRADRRVGDPRASRAPAHARRTRTARFGAEPGRVLPGARGVQSVPRRGARDRRRVLRRASPRAPGAATGSSTTSARPTPSA